MLRSKEIEMHKLTDGAGRVVTKNEGGMVAPDCECSICAWDPAAIVQARKFNGMCPYCNRAFDDHGLQGQRPVCPSKSGLR